MSPKNAEGFSKEELAAMKEHLREQKAAAKRGADQAAAEADVLAKIAELPETDRTLAERIHALIKEHAPELSPKTWYGMPAYARDGKVICFFQSAAKFGARYATFGFNDGAHLDDGAMWPTSYAVKDLTPAVEAQIAALVQKAVR